MKNKLRKKPVWKQVAHRGFSLLSCLAYHSSLKMEVTSSSRTLVDFLQSTWHFIPEDRYLHNYSCENLISYTVSSQITAHFRNAQFYYEPVSRESGHHRVVLPFLETEQTWSLDSKTSEPWSALVRCQRDF